MSNLNFKKKPGMVVHACDGKGEGKNYYDCKQNIVEPKFDFIPQPCSAFSCSSLHHPTICHYIANFYSLTHFQFQL